MIPVEIEMQDGSIFRWPSEYWKKAFDMKYRDEAESTINDFIQATESHWENHTTPDKFGEVIDWSQNYEQPTDYEDHADLGKVVMYVAIRAPLIGLALSEFGGKGKKVVAIQDDGSVVEYGAEGKKESEG